MPERRPQSSQPPAAPRKRQSFRRQYDELEARRAELCARLRRLGDAAQRHSAYTGAIRLLNNVYRKERLAQRLAVLQAAAWLIDVLERLTSTM